MLDIQKSVIQEIVIWFIFLHFLVLPMILAFAVTASIANRIFRRDYIAAGSIALFSIMILNLLFDAHKTLIIGLSILACIGGILIGLLFRKGIASKKILVLSTCFFIIACTYGSIVFQKYDQEPFGSISIRDFNPLVVTDCQFPLFSFTIFKPSG